MTSDSLREFKFNNDKCVFIIPGGGWEFVNLYGEGDYCAQYFNSLGFDAIVYKYKTYTEMPHKDMLKETEHFVEMLQHQKTSTYKKIGVVGFSAGAQIAALFMHHFDFAILVYGALNLTKNLNNSHAIEFLCERMHTEDATELLKYCPTTNLRKCTTKVMLYHTKTDPVVNCNQSEVFYDKMISLQNNCSIHLQEEGTHGGGIEVPNLKELISTFIEKI